MNSWLNPMNKYHKPYSYCSYVSYVAPNHQPDHLLKALRQNGWQLGVGLAAHLGVLEEAGAPSGLTFMVMSKPGKHLGFNH